MLDHSWTMPPCAISDERNQALELEPGIESDQNIDPIGATCLMKDGFRKNSNPLMLSELKTLVDNKLNAVADYLSRL